MIDEKSIQANNGFKDPAGIPEDYVFRDQRGRYPWWVKSVDRITTPVDIAAWKRLSTNQILMMLGPDREKYATNLTATTVK